MSYSASGMAKAPKVAVSTTSAPTLKKSSCICADEVGPGEHEHLVAALEGVTTEVVRGEVELLHVGAEGAVVDHDPLGDEVEEPATTHPSRLPAGCSGPRSGYGARSACRISTRRRVTTAPPGCSTAAGWPRTGPRPEAYGTVDELQACIGVARAECEAGGELDELLDRPRARPLGADGRGGHRPGQPRQADRRRVTGDGGHGHRPRGADRRDRRAVRDAHGVRRPRPEPGGRGRSTSPAPSPAGPNGGSSRSATRRPRSCRTSTACPTCCGPLARWQEGGSLHLPPTDAFCVQSSPHQEHVRTQNAWRIAA